MPENSKQSWGLAALGNSGQICVDVDEATSGPERWQLTLDCPNWHLRFDIIGPQAVTHWLAFLNAHDGMIETATLSLGTFLGSPVVIIKDDEFADRFFLVVGGEQTAHFTFTAEGVQDLKTALKQTAESLPVAA
jgi:hypothetical protein